ncbi:XrtA system polysaccharide chain length determinant [Thiohalophilus thiocyanatoxydans]|uniref:Polysaccharide chain length determinant protein (PEP-CTERM system associated) n=1 Tax=Thiohalophilus thiocyanatoxydans TaxID=381308 RepID=A0A4R8IRX0_9GAMM|nr:XrtA system polysaccharide chain length determinant [Thiohalophilus thiocyanatoxydans]TDY03782.1 polysaccharide chain length determinant protein (PEP-CTERM system associated) [Thiohalophilus thiocyanatoxydans]
MHDLLGQFYAYARETWRYRWLALAVAWVICVAGWLFVFDMPDEYRASARVHVDTQSMLRPLLRGLAVDTNLTQRVNLMTRTLLTRPNMEKVARMTDMHLEAQTDAQMHALVERLRNKISIQGNQRENLYTLSYNDRDPQRAHAVVQAILTIFTESALGDTRLDSDMAQSFIEKQIKEYEKRLTEAEQRLANFRRKNVGMLPSDRGDYYQRLQQAQNKLEEAQLRLREAKSRREEVRRQLAGEEPSFGITNYQESVSGNSNLDTRIQDFEKRLDEMLLTYTGRHPDVIALKRTIANLEQQKQEQVQLNGDRPSSGNGQLETNPVYQQMRISLSNAEVEISTLKERVQRYEQEVNELRQLVDTIPEIEAELKRLNRDYNVNRTNYEKLLERRETAEMSQDFEEGGQQMQFRVIEPSRVPDSPAEPNRPLLLTGVLFVGLGVGLALGFIVSQLRPVFHDRRTLNSVTQFPVLGTVSLMMDEHARSRRRTEMLFLGSITALLLIAYAVVVVVGGK